MKEYRFKVQFICNDAVTGTGYYQLVRISDGAIFAAKQSFRDIIYELYRRRIADVTIWE